MTEPAYKSPKMAAFLEDLGQRTTSIQTGKCANDPLGCGKDLKDTDFVQGLIAQGTEITDNGPFFKDRLSAQEYRISGMCQDCQNATFGSSEEDWEI